MARSTQQDLDTLEPTLWGAIKRYWLLVVVMFVVGGAAGAGAAALLPPSYNAPASIAIPPSQSQVVFGQSDTSASTDQYISNQVQLLQSPGVADRTAHIVNAQMRRTVLTADDVTNNLTVNPPSPTASGATGTQGASTVGIVFSWKTQHVAVVGANAVLTAFQAARNDQLKAQVATATSNINSQVATIDSELTALEGQLNQVDQQLGQQAQAVEQEQQAILNAGGKVPPASAPVPNATAETLLVQEQGLTSRKTDLLSRLDTITVNEQVALTQQAPIVPATNSTVSSGSHIVKFGALGLVAGLLVGVAAAYVVALRRRRFSNRFDPESVYGAPLLGDIPLYARERIASALPVATDGESATAEAYRFVAASLRLLRSSQGNLSVVITSARVRAGKTATAANLALALAQSGARVLAVDADFVRQELTRRLLGSPDGSRGLIDVLQGRLDIEQAGHTCDTAPADLLTVLPGGLEGVRLTGVSDELVRGFVATAKEKFDYVVIDGPPVLQAASASEFLRSADGTVVVLNHDEPMGDHPEVVERLRLMQVNLLGYVYNRAPLRRELTSYYSTASPAEPRMLNGKATIEIPTQSVSVDGSSGGDGEPVEGSTV